ncbi:hypothetical protein ACWDYH_03845 [Nocardia goodfellowii]
MEPVDRGDERLRIPGVLGISITPAGTRPDLGDDSTFADKEEALRIADKLAVRWAELLDRLAR